MVDFCGSIGCSNKQLKEIIISIYSNSRSVLADVDCNDYTITSECLTLICDSFLQADMSM